MKWCIILAHVQSTWVSPKTMLEGFSKSSNLMCRIADFAALSQAAKGRGALGRRGVWQRTDNGTAAQAAGATAAAQSGLCSRLLLGAKAFICWACIHEA